MVGPVGPLPVDERFTPAAPDGPDPTDPAPPAGGVKPQGSTLDTPAPHAGRRTGPAFAGSELANTPAPHEWDAGQF